MYLLCKNTEFLMCNRYKRMLYTVLFTLQINLLTYLRGAMPLKLSLFQSCLKLSLNLMKTVSMDIPLLVVRIGIVR